MASVQKSQQPFPRRFGKMSIREPALFVPSLQVVSQPTWVVAETTVQNVVNEAEVYKLTANHFFVD